VSPTAIARLVLGIGLVLYGAAVYILAEGAGLAVPDALMASGLLVIVPALGFAQLPLARDAAELERIPAYLSSIVALGVIGGASWLVGTRTGGPVGIGLVPVPVVGFVLWTIGLTSAGLGIVLLFRELARRLGAADTDLLRVLLPRTGRERVVFGVLSVFAGVGEEIAYRGYLILALAPVTGTVGAAAVSTGVFGIIHAYQGTIGVARTGLMGAALAGGFLASGSLWAPILAHVLIDLLAGLVLGERLLVSDPESEWK